MEPEALLGAHRMALELHDTVTSTVMERVGSGQA